MNNYKKILSHNIKQKRKSLGLTQYELAERLNVEDKYLSRLETGTSTPSFALLEKLADVFNITIAELFITEDTEIRKEFIKKINEQLKSANIEKLSLIAKIVDLILDKI